MVKRIRYVNQFILQYTGELKMSLRRYSTEEIVKELENREGVEVFVVSPDWRAEVFIENEYDEMIYDAKRLGPEIILRIID